jgi:hypothetical protein
MKKGVLVCLGGKSLKNIGDYVQSIAARQFAGGDAAFVERERLASYDGEPVKLVMNAWFMFHPEQFPPAPAIVPLFTSFHVRPLIERRFFTDKTVAYLKAHEPIGCRSTDAVAMLERHGIKAEFSSCLTLTLGETYHHVDADTPPVFVDPFFRRFGKTDVWNIPFRIMARLPYLLRHFGAVKALAGKFRVFREFPRIRFPIVRWHYAAEFHRAYAGAFGERLLLAAEYVAHRVPKADYPTDEALLKVADERLRRYEKAPFVVTSRLHCALPCLAMGTPLWFVHHEEFETGRFGGNLDFLNVLEVGPDWRVQASDGQRDASGFVSAPKVRTEYKPYADRLSGLCRRFMAE